MIDPHETSAVPLVSEHDTWISVDPIVGCLANCTYCYLGPHGLRGRRPMFRESPADLAAQVGSYLDGRSVGETRERLTGTPVCFGNYTDTFMSADTIDYFKEYAKLHAESFSSHPLCIVTKARLKPDDLDSLDQLQHPMIIFVSQSFLRRPGNRNPERGPTSLLADTINNISLIAKTHNIKPVHFLRPATRRGIPDATRALEILGQMRDSGCLATVSVGLKIGPGIKLSDDELLELLGQGNEAVPGSSEIFPEDVREYLLRAAGQLGYPLYFHTSCAIALATGRAESLGTWREPVRKTRCEPCSCPPAQRSRCDAIREQPVVPPVAAVTRLAPSLGLSEGSLRWSETESAFHVEQPVRQYKFNLLVHALPYRVVGGSVQRDEAWLGPFAEDRALSDDCGQWDPDELLAPGPDSVGQQMYQAIKRLQGITGFVTTLHPPEDPRPLAFARYFHVQRVVRVAEWLWSVMDDAGVAPDRTAVLWLAWAHDLNRWPFAHNSERDYFDQARDVFRYMSGISFPTRHFRDKEEERLWKAEALHDLAGIISKRIYGLSAAGKLVLLADIIAGFIEDPLLAITGLGLSPRLVPDAVREALAMPLDDVDFRRELGGLHRMLFRDRDVKEFVTGFDAVFRRSVRRFFTSHGIGAVNPLEEKWFGDLRSLLKEGFLKRVLFPYNNEKVAHGSLLTEELVKPMLRVLGDEKDAMLTDIDEPGMLELAVSRGIIDEGTQGRYFPDLDYIARAEPENSFRYTL
jgi:hypothetical protein